MSPATRKKATPVCFGEGRVRNGEEQREADPRNSTAGSVSPPGVVEKPPESTNSGEQVARLGTEIAVANREHRTRGTGATLWATIEGQGKPEESGALPELWLQYEAFVVAIMAV